MTVLSMAPTQGKDRIDTVDILRGFAIFGILIVNILFFSGPYEMDLGPWSGTENQLAVGFMFFAAEGRFYRLFSFLFGLGFFLQMQSAEKRGVNFVRFFSHRLFILLLIGILHALLFSFIDVLVSYALLGYVLLLFRKSSAPVLLVSGIICLFMPFVMRVLLLVVDVGSIGVTMEMPPEQLLVIYGQGSIAEIFMQRLRDIFEFYRTGIENANYFKILSMFFLGAWVGKIGLFHRVSSYTSALRLAMWGGLLIGATGGLGDALTKVWSVSFDSRLIELAAQGYFALSDPAMTCFYVAGLTLLLQQEHWQQRLVPLAYVGRTALTNYIGQSVICTTIFYSYGLGLYGQVSPALAMLLVVVIYAVQVALSRAWLLHFRAGPLEWLWRSLTYGKWQPLRVPSEPVRG